MPYLLHALTVSEDALPTASGRAAKAVAAQGTLGDSDAGVARPTSTQPGTRTLRGGFRGQYAALMAREVEELFSAGGVAYVPFVGRDLQRTPDAEYSGYYALENVDTGAADERTQFAREFDGQLRRAGTRQSHRRAVASRPQSVDNPFDTGSDTARLGVDAAAAYPQWHDPVTGTTEPATPTSTVTADLGDVDRYDPDDASFYASGDADPQYPWLVYDLPYDEEFHADCRVFDTIDGRTRAEQVAGGTVGSATVGSSTVGGAGSVASRWQRVYATDHVLRSDAAELILSNGIVRLLVSPGRGSARVEATTGSRYSWTTVPFGGGSEWHPQTVDLTDIDLARVSALVTWANSTDGSTYRLRVTLTRGDGRLLWTRPANTTASVPSSLQTKLSPTARPTTHEAAPTSEIVARSDLQ